MPKKRVNVSFVIYGKQYTEDEFFERLAGMMAKRNGSILAQWMKAGLRMLWFKKRKSKYKPDDPKKENFAQEVERRCWEISWGVLCHRNSMYQTFDKSLSAILKGNNIGSAE